MDLNRIKQIVEAALLAAGEPVGIDRLLKLFEPDEGEAPSRAELREAITALEEEYQERTLEIVEVASGFRAQIRSEYSNWVSRLWDERPPRFSRALMETLAVVAYRQPVTRGEIEDIRGVSVATTTMRTLLDRRWVRVVGHRDVPGRPALYGSTREFLDYFGLKSLDALPTLAELRDFDDINVELDLAAPDGEPRLRSVTPIRDPADNVDAEKESDTADPANVAGAAKPANPTGEEGEEGEKSEQGEEGAQAPRRAEVVELNPQAAAAQADREPESDAS